MDSVCSKIWGASKSVSGSNLFGSEGDVETLWPSSSLSVNNLVHHLKEVSMHVLNGAVSLEVVSGNLNIIDTVLLAELVDGGDIGCL